jgi:hypothetical protein
MKLTTWEKFVCSLISVNQWDIAKTLKQIDDIRSQGLFEVEQIEHIGIIEIGDKLKKGGYDRGALTYMIAERLQQASARINREGVSKCEDILSKDTEESRVFLKTFNGFGPKTVDVFFAIK